MGVSELCLDVQKVQEEEINRKAGAAAAAAGTAAAAADTAAANATAAATTTAVAAAAAAAAGLRKCRELHGFAARSAHYFTLFIRTFEMVCLGLRV